MSDLRIKLLRPVPILPEVPMPSLGMAVVASYLRQKGYNVDQDDICIRFKRFIEENPLRFVSLRPLTDYPRVVSYLGGRDDFRLMGICRRLESLSNLKGYDVIAFSVFSNCELATSLLLAKEVKEKYGSKVVFGGTAMHSPLLQDFVRGFSFVDYAIDGYEQNFKDVLDAIEKGKKVKDAYVKQLYNLKKMPVPDFGGLPLELYGKPLVLPYQPNSGCVMRCSFCTINFYTGAYQEQPVSKIVTELRSLKENYGPEYFTMISPNIASRGRFIKKFCNHLLKENLHIKWNTNIMSTLNSDTLSLMKKAGCVGVKTSLESASERILRLMKKPSTNANYVANIITSCNKIGIRCVVNLICGYPYEGMSDVAATVRFVKKFKDVVVFSPGIFALEYGSPLACNPKEHGITNLRFNKEAILSPRRPDYEFDEINGLKWEDKRKQMIRSFYLVKKACHPAITYDLKSFKYAIPFFVYDRLLGSYLGYRVRLTSKKKITWVNARLL